MNLDPVSPPPPKKNVSKNSKCFFTHVILSFSHHLLSSLLLSFLLFLWSLFWSFSVSLSHAFFHSLFLSLSLSGAFFHSLPLRLKCSIELSFQNKLMCLSSSSHFFTFSLTCIVRVSRQASLKWMKQLLIFEKEKNWSILEEQLNKIYIFCTVFLFYYFLVTRKKLWMLI